MRAIILSVALALTMPLVPSTAAADGHNCAQLRSTVLNNVPLTTRSLPYASLSCAAISELHLFLTSNSHRSSSYTSQRIEAVFRREGLIR